MSVDLTCLGCGALLDCPDLPDTSLYTLDNSGLPTVLSCPPGYHCGQGDSFTLQCCNQQLSVTFPKNATTIQRNALVAQLTQQCQLLLATCGGTAKTLFYNSPQTCTVLCPDGTPFSYTIQAGAVAAPSVAQANQLAFQQACVLARKNRACSPASKVLLAAYWTLNESPLPVNYTDSVSGQLLSTSSGNTVVPGLFGNASRFNTGGFQCGLRTPGFGDSSLGYAPASRGWSAWYWMRVHTQPGSAIFNQSLQWNFYQALLVPSFSFITYIYPVTGVIKLQLVDTNSVAYNVITSGGVFPSVTDHWYLIGASYNATTKTLSLYLNGSLVGSLVVNPALQPLNTGQIEFFNGNVDFTCVWDIDEAGFSANGALSPAQWTSLYNAGAGVTWPAVQTIVPVM